MMSTAVSFLKKRKLYFSLTFTFLLGLGLAYSRAPRLFQKPRFWAEEGTIFYANSLNSDILGSLFFQHENIGYPHLFINFSTFIASRVPMVYAPFVTTIFSLAIVMLLVMLVFKLIIEYSRKFELTTIQYNLLLMIAPILSQIILVGTVAWPEVWLNTINTQVYLGLISFVLVLMYGMQSGPTMKNQLIYGLVAVFLILSSPYSAAIHTSQIIYRLMTRNFQDRTFSRVLSYGLLVNLITLISNINSGRLDDDRFADLSLTRFIQMSFFYPASTLFGQEAAIMRSKMLMSDYTDMTSLLFLLASLLIVCLSLLNFYRRNLVKGNREAIFALISVFLLVLFTGLKDGYMGRYAVTLIGCISIIILLQLLSNLFSRSTSTKFHFFREISMILPALILFSGVSDFWHTRIDTLDCRTCPNWELQVENMKPNEQTRLFVWPSYSWWFEYSKK